MYKLDQTPLLFESSRPGRATAILPKSDVPDRPLDQLIPRAHREPNPAPLPELGRARRGAALHQPLGAEHGDRRQLLSARLVHDEVQSQAERAAGELAGPRRSASLSSRRARFRACWRSSTSCSTTSPRSPVCTPSAFSRRPVRRASSRRSWSRRLTFAIGERSGPRCWFPTVPTGPTPPPRTWPASRP